MRDYPFVFFILWNSNSFAFLDSTFVILFVFFIDFLAFRFFELLETIFKMGGKHTVVVEIATVLSNHCIKRVYGGDAYLATKHRDILEDFMYAFQLLVFLLQFEAASVRAFEDRRQISVCLNECRIRSLQLAYSLYQQINSIRNSYFVTL